MCSQSGATNVLLLGARSYITLDIARKLQRSGHRVFVVDTSALHVCRYSNAVTATYTVPSPRFAKEAFINRLLEIVASQSIGLVIPTGEEIFYLATQLNRFPPSCRVFCEPMEKLEPLHNKWKFVGLLKQYGLSVPETILLKSQEDLKNVPFTTPFALKASYCRASQQVYKIEPGSPLPDIEIKSHNPWIAQKWLTGKRFCTYSICHNGEVNAQATYPVEFAINGTSCLTFTHVSHRGIEEWIQTLVKAMNFTGQIGFDLIETEEGELCAIECNPRATSGMHLFDDTDNLADAFFNRNRQPITPQGNKQKQIMVGMLMYGWKAQNFDGYSTLRYLKTLFSANDVIFNRQDIQPFLAMPYLFSQYWALSRKLKKPLPAVFNHDIEWNNE